MKKLIPLILPLLGVCAGVGAGIYLKTGTAPHAGTAEEHSTAASDHASSDHEGEPQSPPQYVKLNNQFIVPVIEKDQVSSIVVLSISLEIESADSESIFAIEPKLRDGFLQVLFDHSNMGGFQGAFTNTAKMASLRRSLLAAAKQVSGDKITNVLITDLARQNV